MAELDYQVEVVSITPDIYPGMCKTCLHIDGMEVGDYLRCQKVDGHKGRHVYIENNGFEFTVSWKGDDK